MAVSGFDDRIRELQFGLARRYGTTSGRFVEVGASFGLRRYWKLPISKDVITSYLGDDVNQSGICLLKLGRSWISERNIVDLTRTHEGG